MAKLVMYSLATCPTCARARREMEDMGVEYEERVVDGQPSYQQEVLRLTLQRTVPVFVKDGRVVVGFHGEHG